MTGKPTYLWAAEQIIREQKRPMRVQDIIAQAQEAGLFSDDMFSRTPQKSMQARLSMEIVNNGDDSIFVRTGKGVFFLRALLTEGSASQLGDGSLTLKPTGELKPYRAKPRRPRQTKENVLVIPSAACREIMNFQGLGQETEPHLEKLIHSNVKHIARTTAEETEEFKQVITYVLITHKKHVLSFRRGRFNRAAQFLRGSLCIGFGGHVTDEDYSLFTGEDFGIRANAVRELTEEIKVDGLDSAIQTEQLHFLGLINDNSTSLGRKHLAVVYQYEVSESDWDKWLEVSKHELSINELRWINTETETVNLVEFEYWSQLCWRTLSPEMVEAQAEFRIFRKKPFQAPHILVVVGGIGSGKSSATDILAEKFGYSKVNSGRVLAKLMGIPAVPTTPRKEFQESAWDFINQESGPEQLADALFAAAVSLGEKRVIVDGIRQQSTLEALRTKAEGALALLYVYATPDLALRLYSQREGLDETEHESVFFDAIGAEVESDVSVMMNDADAVIYNWSGETNYERAISSMANILGLKPIEKD
ncbi:HTH domain-containing protein [Neptunicoccus sediminis]|uniref:HTH domain-containing protein n=1 Tax=Neptunicoccus sediminis TaxID=1892596 RepID=UPI0012FFA4BE|nr:HTH domain-containing protein [Neptunicoccus sediminis]